MASSTIVEKDDKRQNGRLSVASDSRTLVGADERGGMGEKGSGKEFAIKSGDSASHFAQPEEEESGDIKYRTMPWWRAGAIMLAETVSLGVLSIPSVFAEVGMPAGIILVAGLGAIATYTGYNIGQFKLAYPRCNNMADAGEIMAGKWGRQFLGAAQILFLIFLCGSHVLTGLIALDTISNQATCVIVWAVLITVVSAILTLPRTFHGVAWLSVVSFISILAAVLITMIALGVTGHTGTVEASVTAPFSGAFLSVTNIIFAYAGHLAFLQFISEMKEPKDFPKALVALQITDTTIYIIVGVVCYAYAGDGVTSPALGSTGLTVRRVAYGVAIPTILIAGVINANVAAKFIMHRLFVKRGEAPSKHMTHNTTKGWAIWITIVVVFWVLAFITLCSSSDSAVHIVPFFNDLLGVISSLFAAWFTYGLSGIFWLFITPRQRWFAGAKMTMLTIINFAIIAMGGFIMVAGMYASVVGIKDGYSTGGFGGPFSCTAPKSS